MVVVLLRFISSLGVRDGQAEAVDRVFMHCAQQQICCLWGGLLQVDTFTVGRYSPHGCLWVCGVPLTSALSVVFLAVQIGSFGGITPFQSLLKNRSDLWDVAAAGPIAGIAASTALLAIGLSQSHQGGLPQVWRLRLLT